MNMTLSPHIRATAALAAFICAALSWPAAAAAQDPPAAMSRVSLLRAGQFVWIGTSDSRLTRGRVESVSEQEVAFRAGTRVTRIPWTDIRSVDVEVEDSLGNGLLIGAAIGGAGGGLTGILAFGPPCNIVTM
jgi:hypothetical protein